MSRRPQSKLMGPGPDNNNDLVIKAAIVITYAICLIALIYK